jgi:alkanesulfonate monooxygenase SsuD/methylene tetrahydromethanopterin reductase-like flavin-dependent oxidoreductase (luciferase family)
MTSPMDLTCLDLYALTIAAPRPAGDFAERAERAGLGVADTAEASRITWLPDSRPKVEVDVAATGPRVIELSACRADRIMFALGADPGRVAWGIQTARNARKDAGLDPMALRFGAYVNLVCHPKIETAGELVKGGLTTSARFQVMHGKLAGPDTRIHRRGGDRGDSGKLRRAPSGSRGSGCRTSDRHRSERRKRSR